MKILAAAISGAAVAGFFVVMHADVPYFGTQPAAMFSAASGAFQLGKGASLVLSTVPNDKWLVITDAGVAENTVGDVDLIERDSTGAEVLKLPGAIMAYQTGGPVAMPVAAAHSAGHGVVFHPGTSVVLKNTGYGSSAYGYLVVGYYVDK